ncbi:hypothetical protein [Xylophilus sp. ASV27]|uniref:hypothetical protein n=1 Tax=Xylophilus sp. ASV27 TaxID=2795129 RepID=UPI001E374455|nr:hypothetical protein [Xylophilus sp. ASV27]
MPIRLLNLALLTLLAGCDVPGLRPDPRIAQREADAQAIGGACRYALRGIEDCYNLNPKASKAAVFAGWKDMDQYMRENKIAGQASMIGPAAASAAEADPEAGIDKATEKVLAPPPRRQAGRAASL